MTKRTAAWTKSEITKTNLRLTELESQQDCLEQARKALLLVDDDRDRRVVSGIENGMSSGELFNEHDPDARRILDGWDGRGLGVIRHEIAELRERRALLEQQLPSDEEVAAAQKQAVGLAREATVQAEHFEQSWSAFMAALDNAEEAARQVVEARAKAQEILHKLSELCEQNALDIDILQEPKPSPSEEKLAGLLGSLLRDVGHSQVIDRGLDAEMASAQQQVERESA